MKKYLLFSLLFLFSIILSFADTVDLSTAKKVAKTFYHTRIDCHVKSPELLLVYQSNSKILSNNAVSEYTEIPLFYIFNAGNEEGYIIVSGDDIVAPILGYAKAGGFDQDEVPENVMKWLEEYKNQIRYAIVNNLNANDETEVQWGRLKSGLPPVSGAPGSVNPLISTTWDQSPYYNTLCPYDNNYNDRTVTGCVATAMAQIMKYWNYPAQGTGFHSYNHANYGTLSANFGNTTYQWSSMPNNVNSQNTAVATLMYHCGVGVEMDYGVAATGGSATSSLEPVAGALLNFFQYMNSVQFVQRSSYNATSWTNLMKSELDAGRPIEYGGIGNGGGHAFVCDGYDNNYFHMNWGWSGYYDGYFLLDALNPGGTGTGGGTGGYNYYQQAIIGIQAPTTNTTYELLLYDQVTFSSNPVSYGSGFTVHTDIANGGDNNFAGDFGAAVFDDEYNFVDFVEILTDYTLQSGYHYIDGLDFTTTGLLSLLPGSYYVGIYYRPTGDNWIITEDGSFSNFIAFEVYYQNDIELYADIVISCGTTIQKNEPFIVTMDILNDGNSTFLGSFDVSLYDLEGYFAETIQTLSGADLQSGYYYEDVEFATNGINVEPGTYLLALLHKPHGGNWELSGSSYYTNPVKVIVQEASISPDAYESNDNQANSYNLNANFSNNQASILTTGSNNHVGNDYDYYKIFLPSNFDYTITARAHDSYNSGNGQTYTNDVLWSYNKGGVWSDAYDDVMQANILVKNGGTVYFNVAPYYQGETGTYLLDIQITRAPAQGLDDITFSDFIKVYPNPATDILLIEPKKNQVIHQLKLVDMGGNTIMQTDDIQRTNSQYIIPLKHLEKGTYLLLIQTDKKTWQKKFTKL